MNAEEVIEDNAQTSLDAFLEWIESLTDDNDERANRALQVPDGAIPISSRSEAPEGAQIYEGEQGGLYYLPVGGQAGEDDGATEREQEVAEIAANAEPNELAGGVAAAISDDREDFHDIRNAVVDAETNALAQLRLELELTEAEIDKLAEEVALQEEMRQEFDVVDSLDEIKFGQEVLADRDRPMRGVVDDVKGATVWIKDAHRNITAGVSLDDTTLYIEPFEDEPDVKTAEPGQYGMASNDEVLSDPFDYAANVKGSRDAGIMGGNTTGDKMKILEMSDGSRVFATPVAAYEVATTGVVDGPIEARTNNINSPKVINRLGGNACKTELVQGPGDRDFIAKEGVEGTTFRDRVGVTSDEAKASAGETLAAAYFVGNQDLHGENMMLSDDDELVIIDHDSAGSNYEFGIERTPDVARFDSPLAGSNFDTIYDNAREIKNGDVDFEGIGNAHTAFAQKAADKALRVAVMDPTYDVPEMDMPEEMQTIESLQDTSNWPDTDDGVVMVDDQGDIVDATVVDAPEQDVMFLDTNEGKGKYREPIRITEDSINRIVEVL